MSSKSTNHLFVRIVTADYYIAAPNPSAKDPCYSDFRSSAILQVPVIRIFGPTIDGIKACVHVHGVFPYIFIPNSSELLDQDLYQLAASLDKAINVSLGNSTSNSQHVYKIIQVYGRSFYGYHLKHEKFLQILFYNPAIAKRAADLLQNGIIFNRTFQPHEAHIPYVLQFFIDNNLYGMSFIKLSSFQKRCEKLFSENAHADFNSTNMCQTVAKQTYSNIEVDVTTSDIINSLEESGRISSNPGLALIFEEERKRCNINEEKSSNVTDSSLSLTAELKPTSAEQYFRSKLKGKLATVLTEIQNDTDQNINFEEQFDHSPQADVSVVDEEKIMELTQRTGSLDLSYGEFNSQGRDVLRLLQNLIATSNANNENLSDDIIPSSQHETCEIDFSQPILKQSAENDSILGVSYVNSDGDSDGDDDFTKVDVENRPVFREDELLNDLLSENDVNKSEERKQSDSGKIINHDIPQLDGLNDSSSEPESNGNDSKNEIHLNSRRKTPIMMRGDKCSSPSGSSSGLTKSADDNPPEAALLIKQNLRSNRRKDDKFCSPLKPSKSRKYEDNKSKTIYPQLKINIQKSPKKINPEIQNPRISKTEDASQALNSVCISSSSSFSTVITDDLLDVGNRSENKKLSSTKNLKLMPRKRKMRSCCNSNKIALSSCRNRNIESGKEADDNNGKVLCNNEEKHNYNNKKNNNEYGKCNDNSRIDSNDAICGENSSNSLDTSEAGEDNFDKNNLNSNNINNNSRSNDGASLSDKTDLGTEINGADFILMPKTKLPPTKLDVISYLSNNCLPIVKIKQPFYDDTSDVGVKKNICGKMIKVDSKSVNELEEFKGSVSSSALERSRYAVFQKSCNLSQIGPDTLNVAWLASERSVVIEPITNPPSYLNALAWLRTKEIVKTAVKKVDHRPSSSILNKNKLFVPAGMYGQSDDDDNDDDDADRDSVVSLSQSMVLSVAANTDVEENLSLPSEKSSQGVLNKERTPSQHRHRNNTTSSNSSRGPISPSFLIDCATPENSYGFALASDNLQDIKDDIHYQYITAMSIEIFVKTRSKLNPDPEYDAIDAVFYGIFNDVPNESDIKSGIILIGDETHPSNSTLKNFHAKFTYVSNEEQLLNHLVTIVRQYDPDMLIGYEVEMLSWGYVIHRGKFLGKHFDVELSRVKIPTQTAQDKLPAVTEFKFDQADISGRIVLNVWRLLRHEVTLQSYTFENIVNHVLHQRVPHHSFESLTTWWCEPLHRWLVVDYYLLRVECTLQVLQHLDFLGRTSELARLFGIQFYEVLSRGSQFRVESMMLRMAKPQNFVAVSPSIQQRSKMRAPETVPLIMEPESRFYTDPVIVLDFQSLYPSMIIAYNYCFSTCLGRVEYLGQLQPYEFGCLRHFISPVDLKRIQENLHISPCGVAFVDKSIQTGILPAMLDEILKARLLVKKSMKENNGNKMLQRVLHARQLGLKLIANVTYGYTAANCSGRMPCIEVGDSVVSKGRETLERAIELISTTEKWKARVIYGDTDSLFILVPGRSKAQAFDIGKEMADAVTLDNPKPVKLKFEKVYQPCILQTKKRYVGFMYETPDQDIPTYNAKGIETVRRDGCPAVSKILEKSLKLLFETCNISLVKRYVQRQFEKLISGHISIQELTFAREYRGLKSYRPTACVPALKIAKEALLQDRRSEPRVKERVRYLIIAGHSGMPLINLVRTPEQFMQNPNLRFNAEYYITRVIIPPLDRCFSLLAVSVLLWYTELPRKQLLYLPNTKLDRGLKKKGGTISQYFYASSCLICHKMGTSGLCEQCIKKPQTTVAILADKINMWQRKVNYIEKVCHSCPGNNVQSGLCTNLDCAILYRKIQSKKDGEQVAYVEQLLEDFF